MFVSVLLDPTLNPKTESEVNNKRLIVILSKDDIRNTSVEVDNGRVTVFTSTYSFHDLVLSFPLLPPRACIAIIIAKLLLYNLL